MMPRKWRLCTTLMATERSFNEAGAMMPRKWEAMNGWTDERVKLQ